MTVPPSRDPTDREPPDGGSLPPLGAGVTVNARYRIERELGRGGIGVVYLARDLRLHEMPVVIKCLLDDSTRNPWLSKKFLQEAEALTRIHHPGVVRVIDRDRTADGRSFFVMEFVKGVSLRSAIRSTGVDLAFATAIVRELGQALSAAHREGVLHRDLKPENVMLETLSDGEQHAKLIDFGIAKVEDSREGTSTELGTLAGSLFYLAPEQLLGAQASVASDIYAFAVVAYELVTGRRPFIPESSHHIAAITQLMTLQRAGNVVPPQQLRPSVSAAAGAILLRGLSFDPAARLADARQFGEELAQAMAISEPTVAAVTLPSAPAPVVPPPAPIEAAARRRGWIVPTSAAAVVVAAVSGGYLWLSRSSPAVPLSLHEVATPEPSAPVAESRTLSYSVTLQHDPTRFPAARPITLAGTQVFSDGDLVRFAFRSPQRGHLYIFNESPEAGGSSSMNILFPSPTSNDGAAELAAGRTLTIPGSRGFQFQKEQPTESLWIVWADSAQPALDRLKQYANERDRGEITAAADVDLVRTFLRQYGTPEPEVVVDDAKPATTLRAKTPVLVRRITLEHQ